MTLGEAYKTLGLTPLDQYLKQSKDRDRNLGATTWMLVEAALAVVDGKSIMIIGMTLVHAEELAKVCHDYVFKLSGFGGQVSKKVQRCYLMSNDARIHWSSPRTSPIPGGQHLQEFSDSRYHRMALDRRTGPYSSIRKLIKIGDKFAAYDDNDTFLLELTLDGGEQLVDADPWRIKVVNVGR